MSAAIDFGNRFLRLHAGAFVYPGSTVREGDVTATLDRDALTTPQTGGMSRWPDFEDVARRFRNDEWRFLTLTVTSTSGSRITKAGLASNLVRESQTVLECNRTIAQEADKAFLRIRQMEAPAVGTPVPVQENPGCTR